MKKLKYYLIILLCVYVLVNINLGKSHAYTINLTQISLDNYASTSFKSFASGTPSFFDEDTGTPIASAGVSGTYLSPDGSSGEMFAHAYIG